MEKIAEDFAAPVHKLAVTVQINSIWQTQAGPEYDVRRSPRHDRAWRGLFVVRTLAGGGEFTLADGRVIPVAAPSLLLLDSRSIQRYRTVGESWYQWLVECLQVEPPLFALAQVYPVPFAEAEELELRATLLDLRRETPAEAGLAVARFAMLFYRWHLLWERRFQQSHAELLVRQTVERMHAHPERPLTVARMAQEAHLSEKHFRRLFRAVTGLAPKAFYDRLRLHRARELWSRGMPLAEVAANLGFSDQFHLSKACRRHFGHPPTAARR